MVAMIGVPHGALDPLVAHAAGIVRGRIDMVRFLAVYGLQVVAMIAAWLVVPAVAFSVFLLMSVWHFAGDWKHDLILWQRLVGAATVIFAPAFFHPQETGQIFAALTSQGFAFSMVSVMKPLAIAVLATLMLTALANIRQHMLTMLELLSLPVLAWALPPLAFFVVYFCCLHSPRHLIAIKTQLKLRSSTVWAVTLSITAVTLIIALAVFWMLPTTSYDERVLQTVFVGLAALTVPHMLLLEKIRR